MDKETKWIIFSLSREDIGGGMFLGLGFYGDFYAFSEIAPPQQHITYISLEHGIYDDLFGTDNSNIDLDENSFIWDYDTRFYAKFQNNLMAGNVDYAASSVSSIRIKRSKRGENKWFTLFNIPIKNDEDFNFELFDRYAQANQYYYYSLVPVSENVEGNINKNEIKSEFDNYFILDRNISYPVIFNTKLSTELNRQSNTITTLGNKYPFVISNGIAQYVTGTLSFSLCPMKDCDLDTEQGYTYRYEFDQWIMNGEPKIIKDWTGKIYMIKINDNVSIDYENNDVPSYQISFAEIGNVFDQDDMYQNNFTDVNFSLSSAYL